MMKRGQRLDESQWESFVTALRDKTMTDNEASVYIDSLRADREAIMWAKVAVMDDDETLAAHPIWDAISAYAEATMMGTNLVPETNRLGAALRDLYAQAREEGARGELLRCGNESGAFQDDLRDALKEIGAGEWPADARAPHRVFRDELLPRIDALARIREACEAMLLDQNGDEHGPFPEFVDRIRSAIARAREAR